MATSSRVRALDRAHVVEMANDGGRALGSLVLHFPQTSDGPGHAAAALVVYARQGGFMIAVPGKEELSSYIEELDQFGASEKPGFFEGTAALETTRGRALGEGSVLLVDLPWEMLAHFTYASVLKSSSMTGVDVANWSVEGVAARPVKQSVRELADEWIASGMGEMEAQDYLTGEELLDDPMQFHQPESQAAATQTSENAVLKKRIAELEAQLKAPPQLIQAAPKPASGPGRLSGLFAQSQAATLTDSEMVRLQRLAGVAPPRVAGAEPRRSVVPATTLQEDSLLVDLEREAQEPEEQIAMAQLDPQQFQDPMQKLLFAQLQQNNLLMQKIMGSKTQDPVLGALTTGGGDSASGSSSGVKGCLAREAFLKVVADNHKLAEIVRVNALKELGFDAEREDGSLMRRYVERRIPLADHKLLAHVATLLSEAWATGYASKNTELLGVIGRILIFVEQVAIDGGKLQVGWLLTGVREPAHHLLVSRQKQPGLQPFSRLSAPGWVAANLAYLRDLDYLESKMGSGKPAPPKKESDKVKEEKPDKKGRGKGKKGSDSPEADG